MTSSKQPSPESEHVHPDPTPARSAAQRCVLEHLAAQVDQLVAAEPLVRQGDVEAVHAMRVATRRLRSALATFRVLFDEERTEPFRGELRELGAVLGALRDDHVLLSRVLAAIADQPAELVLGPVTDRFTREMLDRQARHSARVMEVLDSPGHGELLAQLDALVTDPPWHNDHPATHKLLRRCVAHAARRVDRFAAQVAAGDDPTIDPRLHDVRKAAKRARYATEVVRPLDGERAARLAARFEAVQEALGEHQDSVAARALLRQLGAGARGRNENGFTFGLLHQLEAQRGRRAAHDAGPLYRKAQRGRGWLDT